MLIFHGSRLLLLFFYLITIAEISKCEVGMNYGMLARKLPPPSHVVKLLQSLSITKCKTYNPNPSVLSSLANTDISVTVTVPNNELRNIAIDPLYAQAWLKHNVFRYLPRTLITGIAVGNEVLTDLNPNFARFLIPAMQNLRDALSSIGTTSSTSSSITISTPHSLAILASSYPPSSGAFRMELTNAYIHPLLEFLWKTGSPFMVNIYPFLAYTEHPDLIPLGYALFEDSNKGVTDISSGLHYTNMFDAQLDAVHWALSRLGYPNLPVVVSETGWPSYGDPSQVGASVANAQLYITNLARHLAASKGGTPLKPKVSVDVYIFALFNEDLKPGPSSERNYGLFHPDGTMVYDLKTVSSSARFMVSSSSSSSCHLSLTAKAHRVIFALLAIIIISLSL